MNEKIAEVLNSYLEYISAKTEEENRLQGILGQRKVYEKLLEDVALEYGKTEEEKKKLVEILNRSLAEDLSDLPPQIYLDETKRPLTSVKFSFAMQDFDLFNQPVIDVTGYTNLSNLGLFVTEFGEIFHFLGTFIEFSKDKENLEELLKDYKKEPLLINEKIRAEIAKKMRAKYVAEHQECLEKVELLTEEYKIVSELLCSSTPLKENLLNKILYRSQIKLQQKQRQLAVEIDSTKVRADEVEKFIDSEDFNHDVDYLTISDLEALEKLFYVLSKLEERAKTIERFTNNKQNPLFEKRKRLFEKISRNETLEKMYIVRLDERKFAYRAYLQQLFKDEKLASAIMNLSRSDLDAEQWEAAKALKKFVNKNHVVRA